MEIGTSIGKVFFVEYSTCSVPRDLDAELSRCRWWRRGRGHAQAGSAVPRGRAVAGSGSRHSWGHQAHLTCDTARSERSRGGATVHTQSRGTGRGAGSWPRLLWAPRRATRRCAAVPGAGVASALVAARAGSARERGSGVEEP